MPAYILGKSRKIAKKGIDRINHPMRLAGRRQAIRAPTLVPARVATNPPIDALLGRNASGTWRQSTAKVTITCTATTMSTRTNRNAGTTAARPNLSAGFWAITICLCGRQRGDPVRLDRGMPSLDLHRWQRVRLYRAAKRRVGRLAENRLAALCELLQALAEVHAIADQRVFEPLLGSEQRRSHLSGGEADPKVKC